MGRTKLTTRLFFICCTSFFLCGCNTAATGTVPTNVPATPTTELTSTPAPTETPAPTNTPVPTQSPTPTETPAPTLTPTPTPSPTPMVTAVTCSFTGDVTLGSDLINQNSIRNFYVVYDKVQDDSYFFANVLPILKADDLTLINFEGTLSERGKRQDKTFAFRGKPAYVNILLQGSVEAVSLANNHSMDYGQISHDDTRLILKSAGILYAYEDLVSYTTINDIKIAMISIYAIRHGLDGSKVLLDKTIAEAKTQEADLIFTSFHWGIEKDYEPTSEQKELAHYAIDAGADLVVGHHPHVLQPIELYNGHYIAYSLGNFCFGGHTNPADKDTMIFQQTFTFTDGVLTPEESPVRVFPCSLSSVTEKNNFQPTPQTGDEAERIINKLNDFCSSYGISFKEETEGCYIPEFFQPSE